MMTTSLELPSAIALDRWLYLPVEVLLDKSTLSDKILRLTRDQMGTREAAVIVLEPNGRPPIGSWSSGEQALWSFIASISGRHEVNLGDVIARFRGDPLAVWIIAVFATALGDAFYDDPR